MREVIVRKRGKIVERKLVDDEKSDEMLKEDMPKLKIKEIKEVD